MNLTWKVRNYSKTSRERQKAGIRFIYQVVNVTHTSTIYCQPQTNYVKAQGQGQNVHTSHRKVGQKRA